MENLKKLNWSKKADLDTSNNDYFVGLISNKLKGNDSDALFLHVLNEFAKDTPDHLGFAFKQMLDIINEATSYDLGVSRREVLILIMGYKLAVLYRDVDTPEQLKKEIQSLFTCYNLYNL